MNQKPCCSFERHLYKFAAGLFVVLLLSSGLKSQGQSFFYFENQLSSTNDSSLTYYSFLTLYNNGSGVARIRYIEPISKETRLFEVNLLDSADIQAGGDSEVHYLIQDGEALPIEGKGVSQFRSVRFVFKKETAGIDAFYIPAAVHFQAGNGAWQSTMMLENQQKSSVQLKQEANLISIFYNAQEPFYQYLFVIDPDTIESQNEM